MRSTDIRPAPRSMRRLKVCASNFAPVLAAMRAASSSPFSRNAGFASSSTAGSPVRKTRAASFTASSLTRARCGTSGTFAGPLPSSQAVSPGRTSVATCPSTTSFPFADCEGSASAAKEADDVPLRGRPDEALTGSAPPRSLPAAWPRRTRVGDHFTRPVIAERW